MRRILIAYRDLLGIIFSEAPVMVLLTICLSIISGLLAPINIYVNQNVFDGGLAVAKGDITFYDYSIFLVLYIIVAILPYIINGAINNYVQPRSLLILRTAYKARMLKKLKTMKYEHFESEASAEIIDKAYNRAENSARHLWPLYLKTCLSSIVASIGIITYIFNVRWWLLLTVLIPFVIETFIAFKTNYNIYSELETYWKKERKYSTLGHFLRSRDYSKELKAFGNADYLIDTYKDKLNERNRDYERYYFKNLRKILLGGDLTKFGTIINVIIILILFVNKQMSVGLFIAITSSLFGSTYGNLKGFASFFKWSGFHINNYDYYDKFFNLSDDLNLEDKETEIPKTFDIEFKDVWFKYPGTEKYILKGLTFKIKNGEKISIVGKNGEGKSTIIKLLLGLFTPDKGKILIGGKKLDEYPLSVRTKIFGPIFQDFPRYSITIKENIGIGDIDEIENNEQIKAAAIKGKANEFAEKFEKSYDTLLGRNFEGGVDISGGQWQRIAISRAFMGNKPVLLLDEPTSQLDPMAEVSLYNEFAEMVENKTAIFITHRLGSTMITDRILVINGGKIEEVGTHDELMQTDGIYSRMFNAQKQWYYKNGEEVFNNA